MTARAHVTIFPSNESGEPYDVRVYGPPATESAFAVVQFPTVAYSGFVEIQSSEVEAFRALARALDEAADQLEAGDAS